MTSAAHPARPLRFAIWSAESFRAPAAYFALLGLATVAILVLASPGRAQEGPISGRTVTVGLYANPPFVMEEGGRYTGMAVELWEALARPLGLRSEYRMLPTIRALVDATAKSEIDVAVTNLSITQGRAQRVDFTQPWFDAGQRIMVNERQGTGFWQVIDGLHDFGFVRSYLWLGGLSLAAAIALTLLDRAYNPDFPRRWRDGFAESFFAVMSLVAGKPTGRKNIFGWVGRIWQGLWLIFGIAVLAYITSSVTSVMTTLALTNKINSLSDLPGKPVGVFTGSVSEEFARAAGFDLRPYPHIEEAVEPLPTAISTRSSVTRRCSNTIPMSILKCGLTLSAASSFPINTALLWPGTVRSPNL